MLPAALCMKNIVDYPLLAFVLSLVVLWFASFVGNFFGQRLGPLDEGQRADFGIIQGAVLTLLGLLIGFTFSMALSRYDQRKNYEEAEANAIGTEYVRADMLPAADAERLHALLKSYLNQRVLFYTTRDRQMLRQVDIDTGQLQNALWSIVQVRALTQPSPVIALVVSGMNDVLNSQGYTQAAWWNRIPSEAWVLLALLAVGADVLIGYGARRMKLMLIVLPLAISISFFLIADIDSPRGGVIRVQPQNLVSLSQTLRAQ